MTTPLQGSALISAGRDTPLRKRTNPKRVVGISSGLAHPQPQRLGMPQRPALLARRRGRVAARAESANTTIAAGDTTEEIDKLRRGGDGHIVGWGGVSFWRSLDGVPKSYRLDLVSSTEFSNGIVGLHYLRHC